MKHTKNFIFPTIVHLFDNVLEQEYIDSMKEDIIKGSIEKSRGNWQSNPKIHKHPKYKALVEAINVCSKHVLDDNNFVYERFEITDMWSNILKPGEMHRPHTHSNNLISGVFYVESDANANIQFYDPRPQAGVLSPRMKKSTVENCNLVAFEPRENMGLIFPSWLQHWVRPTGSERISLSWNILVKGHYGAPNTLQNAYI